MVYDEPKALRDSPETRISSVRAPLVLRMIRICDKILFSDAFPEEIDDA